MPSSISDQRAGLASAVGAYLIWGAITPIYLKALGYVGPFEVVAHRVIWALPFAFAILALFGQAGTIRRYMTLPMLSRAVLCAAIISVNWGVYVYALGVGRAVDAALGYYINPLVNVALGAIFLRERPSPAQGFAIVLAIVGVLILTVDAGGLPWISLTLACTFSTYGLVRKLMPFGPAEGFFLEVLVLMPFALALLGYLATIGEAQFLNDVPTTIGLMVLGPLTAIPLILFAAGARRLTMATIGVLQYLVPTMLFLIAVFIFGEPFGAVQLVSFAFIWAALIVYTAALLREARRR